MRENGLKTKNIKCDLCVVGGGIAGMNVAITAARLGVKVVLINERPVFGGNASGEIRMWICGVRDYEYRETGIGEEINLENFYYNPTKNYNIWNTILYNKVQSEKNITPLLNCTCFEAKAENGKISSVKAYQMTTETFFVVEADYFADCSGDGIFAPLVGAGFMYGREGEDEYGEPMRSHFKRDEKTMGNSCLLQARKTDKVVPFTAPEWAEKVPVEKLKSKGVDISSAGENFWYVEIGGDKDVVGDAEMLNNRLIALCLGVWDTIKNSGEFDADCYELEFLGFLGAKRESRRMLGDYVLTANDILSAKAFSDTVAYGGWPLDDHNPAGFDGNESNYTINVPKPYGIPYRCLYSVNIDNLFFAGRNISATHMALSSARVMGTCGTLGQAVGAAAFVAKKYSCTPREAGKHIDEIQQTLLFNDCYLPNVIRRVGKVCLIGGLVGGDDTLRNGNDRCFNGEKAFYIPNGKPIKYVFDKPTEIGGVKVVFDSDLTRSTFDMDEVEKHHSMRCNILDDSPLMSMPKTLAKEFDIVATLPSGETVALSKERNNLKRNVLIGVDMPVKEVALTVYANWGKTEKTGVFTFETYDNGD